MCIRDRLLSRYVIRSRENVPLESPQEMFLGIALHLAMLEKNDRLEWVRRFYDMLSTLKAVSYTHLVTHKSERSRLPVNFFIETSIKLVVFFDCCQLDYSRLVEK